MIQQKTPESRALVGRVIKKSGREMKSGIANPNPIKYALHFF